MKRVKRIFACLLALTMMFGLSATAFATESGNTYTDESGKTYSDMKTVTIQKSYKLTNAGTTSPGETFTLEQVGEGTAKNSEATSAPALGRITGAHFEEGAATVDGATGDIKVALPAYERVGVYEYTLKEVAGSTAGVDYYGKEIKLVVTVVNGDNGKLRIAGVHTEAKGEAKSASFTNTYSAGTLKVSKTVEGNLGDQSKYFVFTVTLTAAAGKSNYLDSYKITGGSDENNPPSIKVGETKTFKLKHGETINIEGLPYGVTYTVTETAVDGYTTTVGEKTTNIAEGTMDEKAKTVVFTNTKNGDIDTGVYLDNLPYILVFAGVLAIAAVFVVRRRRFED